MSNFKERIKVVILVGDGNSAKKIMYNGEPSYSGFGHDVWQNIKKKLEERYKFQEFYFENYKSFSGVVDLVASGKYDIAIDSFYFTQKRAEKVNYTIPHSLDSITVLQRRGELSHSKNFLFVLKKAWKLVVILLALGLLFGFVLFATDKKRFQVSSSYLQERPNLFLNRTILTGLSSMLGQTGLLSESSSLTIVSLVTVVVIMFIAFIFSNFLQAEIVSLLLQKPKTSLTRKNIGSKKLIGIAGFASSIKMAKLNPNITVVPYQGTISKHVEEFKRDKKYDGLVLGYNNSFQTVKDDDEIIPVLGFGNELAGFVVNKNKEVFLKDVNNEILKLRGSSKLTQICNTYFSDIDRPVCSLT